MVYISNKLAYSNYEIVDTVSAGISLYGFEVKSIKNSKGELVGAKVLIRGGECFLVDANIRPYQAKNTPQNYDPKRTRRLLFTKKEISKLSIKIDAKKLTMVPIKFYNKNRKLKLEIGIGTKLKAPDKKEKIKEKDLKREIERDFKLANR